MLAALKRHWPAYLIEARSLALFMIAAGLLTTAFAHPGSALHELAGSDAARRLGVGVGMAVVTTVLVSTSMRSGAHMNPAVTLAFLCTRKIAPVDAAWYVVFQSLAALAAPHLVLLLVGDAFRHDAVRMATTTPGPRGAGVALAAELALTFGLILTVLLMVNHRRLRGALPVVVGLLVGAYIALESHLSGMSMNPARTLGSALASGRWDGWWLYIVAPTLGAVSAVAAYGVLRRLGFPPGFEDGPHYPQTQERTA